MKEQIEDDEYLCEVCQAIMEKDEKIISRHKRICEKIEPEASSVKAVLPNQDSGKYTFTPITHEMLGMKSVSDIFRLEEIDLRSRELTLIVNKKNIDFTDFLCLKSLNLSNNKLKDLSFLTFLGDGLKVLNIGQNNIESLHFIEHLSELEILYTSGNSLSIISSLAKLPKLKELTLDNNNLQYTTSTLKILNELQKLRLLTIYNNPFLNEIQSYKHIFVHKFKNLEKLDNAEITSIDADLAKQYFESNQLNKTWYNQSFKKSEAEDETTTNVKQEAKTESSNNITKEIRNSPAKLDLDLSEYKNKTFVLKSKPKEQGKITEPIKFKGTTITPMGVKKEQIKLNPCNLQSKLKQNDNNTPDPKPQRDENSFFQNEIKRYEAELKHKDIKIEGLETQMENLINITVQLESQLDTEKREKEQMKLNKKQIVFGKDKQLKSEK